MTGEIYRLLLSIVLVVGLVAGGAFLLLFRPHRWLRDPLARDASGWVVIVVGLYAWSAYRLVVGWAATPDPPRQPLSSVLVALGFGLALDGALIHRLRRYMAALEAERIHPTRVCPRCGGAGVVPLEEGA